MADQSNDVDRIAELEAKVAALTARESTQQPLISRLLKFAPWLLASHVLVGAPTLLISLVVAYGTFVQAEATQKMQQGDAWPFLSYGTSNVNDKGEREISLSLANNGVGPALLGPVEIRYQGKPVIDTRDLLTKCCGLAQTKGANYATSPTSGIAVSAGKNTEFLRLAELPTQKDLWTRLERERWKLQLRSCYCSIFDDCWVIEGRQAKPKPVEACPTNWTVFKER